MEFHGRPCIVMDDRVHFYWKTALGILFFLGIKSSFAMFLHLVSWGFCEVDKLSPARKHDK